MVLRRRRPRRRHQVGATDVLAGAAILLGGGVGATELARVWRRGPAPLPAEADDVLEAGVEALEQTLEVAVAGYRGGSTREQALLNVLAAFTATSAAARTSAHLIRRRGVFGPFRDLVLHERHIHHFVPGIALAFGAGGVAIVTRSEDLERWLALPFGAGVALTLDESALLLELDDVYWTERGVLSVQVTLSTIAVLSGLLLALRALRRGEAEVLDQAAAGAASASSSSRAPSPHAI